MDETVNMAGKKLLKLLAEELYFNDEYVDRNGISVEGTDVDDVVVLKWTSTTTLPAHRFYELWEQARDGGSE